MSPPLHTLLDQAGLWTNATAAHIAGATGAGVLVGVADTGLDVTHPDFFDANGNTRVAWILDLSAKAYGKYPDLELKYGYKDASGTLYGAVYAGTGRLNIVLVVLLGFLGALIGDNIGFAIGHFGGRRLVERYGRYILLTRERLDRATEFFERQGGKIIVVARFVEGLRQANGIIAGISGMHWARFAAFNAIGAALWVAVWCSVGYFSGSHINAIYADATRYSTYFAIALGAALVGYVAWRLRRRRRTARGGG